MMYGTKSGTLYIDDIPLGDMKQLEEISAPDIDAEYDGLSLEKSCEIDFKVTMKQSAINKIFRPCFGIEPYRNLDKCGKCNLKNDRVKAKIENNFNMKTRRITTSGRN